MTSNGNVITVPTVVRYTPGQPLGIDGRVVGVLSCRPSSQRVTVLVEKNTDGNDNQRLAQTSEGVEEMNFESTDGVNYCAGMKSGGSRCGREVDEPGDTCWQH